MAASGKRPLPELVRELARAVLTSQGETSPELREATFARAAALGGAERCALTDAPAGPPAPADPAAPAVDVPGDITAYLDKVAGHAYKVTDEDVAALKSAGYSEDAIFELTLSAALGASMARLEQGRAALRADRAARDRDDPTPPSNQ